VYRRSNTCLGEGVVRSQQAAYKTCCLAGMTERQNFVKKPTGANKKFNLKICPDKQTENWGNPQAEMV
jgi:hypothetical protein